MLLPFVVKEEMGGSAFAFALVFAMGGIGAMLAAIVMANRGIPRRNIIMYVVWTVSTLMVARIGDAALASDGVRLRVQCAGERRTHRLDHDEATAGP